MEHGKKLGWNSCFAILNNSKGADRSKYHFGLGFISMALNTSPARSRSSEARGGQYDMMCATGT